MDARPSTGQTLQFDVPARLEEGKSGWRFLGDFVKAEGKTRRFVYVAIGRQAGQGDTGWDRRAKVDLPQPTADMIAKAKAGKLVLLGEYAGSDSKGEPACASVAVTWRIDP